MTNAQREIKRKLRVPEHAASSGNISKTCRYFGNSRGLLLQQGSAVAGAFKRVGHNCFGHGQERIKISGKRFLDHT